MTAYHSQCDDAVSYLLHEAVTSRQCTTVICHDDISDDVSPDIMMYHNGVECGKVVMVYGALQLW